MSGGEVEWGTLPSYDRRRVVSCDLVFAVAEPGEVAFQVVAADSAGRVVAERFDVTTDGAPPAKLEELRNPQHERIHVVHSAAGRLNVSYRAEIETRPQRAAIGTDAGARTRAPSGFERQLYMRPSRYCPSDHLVGFAVAEFRLDTDVTSRVANITEWIRRRISYVPGSSDVHDSAEHTLLTGMGTCRDFAHLGIALCRATGIPARFVAVYAPGLFPMDFHAVFETLQLGRWTVHDATGLAPRASMVRIATGRDAADAAFSAVNSGVIDMEFLEVSATVGSVLPWENPAEIVELA
jgi:transglutaminase-like putative cysteine protease